MPANKQDSNHAGTEENQTITSKGPNTQAADSGGGEPPIVPPPDGGWGWVVVISSFMISVFVDGVCFSVGIFFTPFREYFDSSKAQTAWVGSVLNGTYLSIGPVVGAFVNRYGCRKMTLIGSIIAATSFFLSTFSTSIPLLIVTYGLLGGIGFGFVYLPAIVMVGYYFERRRALATGIACCGSGIGAFVFAPLGNFLLETYGWKGATWILSSIVLNGMVFAIFYRPLQLSPDSQDKAPQVAENGDSEQMQSLLKKTDDDDDDDERNIKDPVALLQAGDTDPVPNNVPDLAVHTDGGSSDLIQVLDADRHIFSPRTLTPDICIELTPPPEDDDGHIPNPAEKNEKGKADGLEMSALDGNKDGLKNDNAKLEELEKLPVKLRESLMKNCKSERPLSDIICTVTPKIHQMESPESQTFRSDFRLKDPASPVARLAYSQDAFSQLRVRKSSPRGGQHHHHSHHHLDVNSPLQRKDIFYSGSLRHIPEYQSSETLDDYRRKVMEVEEVEEEEEEEKGGPRGGELEKEDEVGGERSCLRRMVCEPLLKVFDVTLLRSPTFVIYGFSCFLCMLGFFVPFIYLPTLTLDLGVDSPKSAFLISIIGIANTIGRVAVGFVSDQPWADCLLINNVALVIGGAATCCVPFLSLYPLFAVYTFIFGTSIAVFVSLRSIIMVELMGLQKLTNAFGLVIMCQGISTYIGAPIAGMLSDLTGDYNISFYVAGIFMALSGVICFPLRRIARWETARARRQKDALRSAEAADRVAPDGISKRD